MKTKSTQVKIPVSIHTKIQKYALENGGLTIPEATNHILKNFFRIGGDKEDDLLTPDEVREVFNKCLENTKKK